MFAATCSADVSKSKPLQKVIVNDRIEHVQNEILITYSAIHYNCLVLIVLF